MNFGKARVRLVPAVTVFAAAALIGGCGNNYRPVVTPVNPTGPAAQPQSFAVVVSAPSTTAAGIATIVDYSGDSVMAIAPIGPGPSAFTVDETGSNGYTINSDGTLTNFPVSSGLNVKNVAYSTLGNQAQLVNLFSPSSGLWAADLCSTTPLSSVCESGVDVFSGSPETLLRPIPVATTPVLVVGPGLRGQRYFAVSQNIANPTGVECNSSPSTGPLGTVTGIEVSSDTTDTPTITVGRCPVYAVESSDGERLFVLNRGSDTVSVINSVTGAPDQCSCPPTGCVNLDNQSYTCHPTLPLSTTAGLLQDAGNDVPAIAEPVYAEYNAAKSLLVVANYAGNTVNVIDVSLDEYGNDSPTFGTTYTIPVGNNPASVTVLYDGSRAYTANQADQTVTVVNLSSYTVEKTLPVTGHPRTVVSTQNSTYGKVYVASPDSNIVTIIGTGGTDPDSVDTTVAVQGDVVDVRVQTQNAVSGNSNNLSRVPGYGQPCNRPGAGPTASLAACKLLP